MDDSISRQAAIDGVKLLHDVAWKNWHEPTLSSNVVIDMIRDLPPAEPEQRWIPASERLPEEHDSIWKRFKGTDKWSKSMWETQSNAVIVTSLFEDGTMKAETSCLHDGTWYFSIGYPERTVVAWMPMPEPYERA